MKMRRIGSTPQQRGSLSGQTCPDIFELEDGRFAIIGTEMTTELEPMLPEDASLGDDERIVVITRQTLLDARRDINKIEEEG